MNLEALVNKWSAFELSSSTTYKSLRIDSVCMPDLFIGFDKDENRCLILKLPTNYLPDFQSSIRQNLSLYLYNETKWIVLSLLDDSFKDLFNDLILSIYNKIFELSEPDRYVSELLKTYYKWSEFFQENSGNLLSDQQVKGVFGELIVLKNLLESSLSNDINDILNSWKGLYDTGHDFINENQTLEVKTKDLNASTIKISSEYQLEPEIGKELELLVVNVLMEPLIGISLKDLFISIREYVIVHLADYTLLLKAISQKGLTIKKMEDFDHLKFKPVNIISYNCMAEDFPKIIRSFIPTSINSVSYKVNLNDLQSFIKTEITL
ncbi:PD-(D/E)XK motif protein [Pedobacter sp. UC225_61]|uniref:PD-(D/E)XK motif protein n=1 Tax=Pedobacter sp. UC225_61 TaxID=3374623 RepID=UPI0037AB1186